MAKFTLSPLPWDEAALEPVISARTISFHYGKHHKSYVETLNKLTTGTRHAGMKLEEVVRATAGKQGKEKEIFNNAAQVWNHDFYWRSLTPKSSKPSAALARAIERDFGSMDKLLTALAEAGEKQFGTGWAWLTSSAGKLAVENTPDAETPMAKGTNCLLTVDVWEHAYYLDYQNQRPAHLKKVLKGLLNWRFASENLDQEDHPVRAAA